MLLAAALLSACGEQEPAATTAAPEESSAPETTAAETEAETPSIPETTEPETAPQTELERLEEAYSKVTWRVMKDKYAWGCNEYEAKGISKGGIVFYGSSGFTSWSKRFGNDKDLEDMIVADDGTKICVNHGLGGTTVHELCYFYDRMVKAYEPKALVISSFINDITKGYQNDKIMICLEYLCEMTRTDFPGINIYITDYRPNAKFVGQYDLDRRFSLNQLVKEYCDAHDDCTFIELSKEPLYYKDAASVGTYMNVNTDIFLDDLLHLKPEGYVELAKVYKRVLAKELASSEGFIPAKK